MIRKIFVAALMTMMIFFAQSASAYDYVTYRAYVSGRGWMPPVRDGEVVGTTGEGRAMEALMIDFNGGIKYRAHVQDIGWQDWSYSGEVTGTVDQGLQMEAICIQLVGRSEQYFDVYYRAHVKNKGWLGWAKNGEPAGSAGESLRLEALQIMIVEKGRHHRFDRDHRPAFIHKR